MTSSLTVAHYYPGYHPDRRMSKWHYPGANEWDLLRAAKPHFCGHYQPRVPAWGYEDESKVSVMQRKVAVAAAHGIDAFSFCYYYYRGEPLLGGALRAFLASDIPRSFRSSIIWANHDWPADFPEPVDGRSGIVLERPDYSDEALERMVQLWITELFSHPSYLRLADERLLITIHLADHLINGIGSVARARAFVDWLRSRVREAGLGELYILSSQGLHFREPHLFQELGFDGVTNYCLVGYRESPQEPLGDLDIPDHADQERVPYGGRIDGIVRCWEAGAARSMLPYHPVATVGRDCTPRVTGPAPMRLRGRWGNRAILVGENPTVFEEILDRAYDFARETKKTDEAARIVFINSWNEWTEGSYLEPDTKWGPAFLEAVARSRARDRRGNG
jgi:hypothetical protein